MTNDEIAEAVRGWAANEPLIRRVYLFGSRAKGTSRPDSDVDLAIWFDVNPSVRGSCDVEEEHYCSWFDLRESWSNSLGLLLNHPLHVEAVSKRDDARVWSFLKECRICIYQRATLGQTGTASANPVVKSDTV